MTGPQRAMWLMGMGDWIARAAGAVMAPFTRAGDDLDMQGVDSRPVRDLGCLLSGVVAVFLLVIVLTVWLILGVLGSGDTRADRAGSPEGNGGAPPVGQEEADADPTAISDETAFVPESGRYEIVNGPGTVTRGDSVTPLPPGDTASPVVEVAPGGNSLTVAGFGDGVGPSHFRRIDVDAVSATYLGTVTVVDEAGAFAFDFTLVFHADGTVSGTLVADVEVVGQDVVARRSATGQLVDPAATLADVAPAEREDADIVSGVEVLPPEGMPECTGGERVEVEDAPSAPDPRDALRAFLDGASPQPPVGPPYLELRRGDGAVFYGWTVDDGSLGGVVEVPPDGAGAYRVVAWLTAECPAPTRSGTD